MELLHSSELYFTLLLTGMRQKTALAIVKIPPFYLLSINVQYAGVTIECTFTLMEILVIVYKLAHRACAAGSAGRGMLQ